MMDIVIAVLSCTAFWQLIDHWLDGRKKKKFDIDQAVQDIQKDLAVMQDNQASMQKGLTKAERDSVRTQLLLLMSDYPDNTEEIMGVAEHYFHDLGGNWYMTTLFNRWLEREEIGRPDWFRG